MLGSPPVHSVIIWIFNDVLNGEAIRYIVGWDTYTNLNSLNARIWKEPLRALFEILS